MELEDIAQNMDESTQVEFDSTVLLKHRDQVHRDLLRIDELGAVGVGYTHRIVRVQISDGEISYSVIESDESLGIGAQPAGSAFFTSQELAEMTTFDYFSRSS